MNAALLLALLACRADKDAAGGVLEVTLDRDGSVAGEDVGIEARFVGADGASDAVLATYTSDIEDTLATGADTVRPTVAGEHVLTATGTVDGVTVTGTATLAVNAAAVGVLDLVLDADHTVAGVDVGWTLQAVDAFGNAADASTVTWDADPALTLGDGVVGATEAGTWSLAVTVGTAHDTATLGVEPAEPATLDLTVTQAAQTADVYVEVRDAFGNVTDDSWTLAVDGPAHGMRGRDTVVFSEEGWATFTATVDGTAVADTVGPLAMDWSAPVLTVANPLRSDWLTPGTQIVTGTVTDSVSGVSGVTVNGVPATIDGDRFSASVDVPFGLHVLQVEATDARGAAARDVRAVMAGDRTPTGEWVERGLIVRMVEGDEGLGALAEGMMAVFDPGVLVDALPTPLVSDSSRVCTTVFGVRVCTTYSLTATITDLTWGDATLALDPRADGTLHADMAFTDVAMPWTATGSIAGSPYSGTGTGTASSLVLGMELRFDVTDHVVDVTITDVTVTANDLDLALPSWVNSVSSTLGVDPEATAIAELESAADAELPAILEENLEGSLQQLSIDTTWTVARTGGRGARFVGEPMEITADATGLDVTLATSIAAVDWAIPDTNGGSLRFDGSTPDWSTLAESAAMAASIDTYNQLFYANWGTGQQLQVASAADLEVDMAVFATAFPGISDLVVATRAYLPPTLIATEDGFEFDIPNLEFRLYNGAAVVGDEVYILHVSSFTRGTFAMTRGELDIVWDRPVVYSHIERAPPEADLSFLDPALESMFAGLNLNGSRHLGTLELPEIAGYALQATGVTPGGPENGYILISGGLAAP